MNAAPAVAPAPPEGQSSPSQARRAVLASVLGTTVEYYDFFIYGTAASLVFSTLFFPEVSSFAGTLLSLSTFAIAFVMRPVGAAVFGHFGDRLGRKQMLFITLSMMGLATLAIGLLPGYDQIGIGAPLLLVLARLLQGFSLGGEQAGAFLMSIESAQTGRRSLWGALVNSGAGWGLLLANLVFLGVSQLPEDDLLSWGWRIPFVLSAVLVGVGLFVRLRLEESTEFAAARADSAPVRAPLVDLLHQHKQRVALVALCLLASGVNFYIVIVFALGYGETRLDKSNGTMLSLVLAMTVVMIVGIPAFGVLADRIGRRKVFLASSVGLVVAPTLWFLLVNTASYPLMLLGYAVLFVAYCANAAAAPSFLALAFPSAVRYSGLAIGFNVGTLLGASLAPLVAAALVETSLGWVAVAIYMSTSALVTVLAAWALRQPDSAPH